MNRSTIQNILADLGTRPTKSLGQNFLHDEDVARWIVKQLDLQPGDHLVEIGPGLGALTEHALDHQGPITLIEKDGRLAGFLEEEYGHQPNVTVLHLDALKFDNRTLFEHGPTKVLGNLPYYVSSQVLLQFTADPTPVTRLVFTLQKEMAERLSAKPSTKEYGALTLLVGLKWKVAYVKTLPGSVFLPAPNVESGIIVITPRDPAELPSCDNALFNRLVKSGFSQRRKMLRNMLATFELDWPALCAALNIEETVRGEALSLRQWVDIARYVEEVKKPGSVDALAQDVAKEIFDVVDEENNVISQATREEVHANRLRHRAIHLLITNKHGDLFLQKRSRWKDANPGRWDSSTAGHVSAGESYETTVVRELEEELNVTVPLEAITQIGEIPACAITGQEFVRIYHTEHNGPFLWPRAEVESGCFFPVSVLERWTTARPKDFSFTFLECFKIWQIWHNQLLQ